ncbi:MAG TPA: aldo/keto reductase [Candidatus Binatia bacterium]|jgi:diketogulonate reductase-like aldo/keto reductase
MQLTIDSQITLNDGRAIPQLGLGVWQTRPGKTTEAAALAALEAGYRHIDTAAMYGNEESVGAAIRASGIARESVFITTKLWNSDHGDPERALETSLAKLKFDHVDLYLIHYPVPKRRESWRVFETLKARGKARSIGVSNFTVRHLTELLAETDIVPAVNQVEFHPYLYQRDLLDFCAAKGIVIEAYSPLTHGERLNDPKLVALAKKYSKPGAQPAGGWSKLPLIEKFSRAPGSKSTAQILIRWALQHGLVVIPKSTRRGRIFENADVFDFEISAEDMRLLDGLNEDLRTCWDPTKAP